MQQIAYRVLVKGLQHFDCARLSATLSTISCATRHELAKQHSRDGLASACLRCPIGVHHSSPRASNGISTLTPDTGATCVRCGRMGLRILPSKGICVSCSNRAAEYAKGRNSKGAVPAEYSPLTLRRVGVVVEGKPAWQLQEVQNAVEPLARVRRAGLEMHVGQPGASRWCPVRQAFEYRDKSGRTLAAQLEGGMLSYVAAGAHEQPATVTDSGTAMHPEALQVWLALSGETVGDDWRAQFVICDQCHHAPLQARKHTGRIECRCLACGAAAAAG